MARQRSQTPRPRSSELWTMLVACRTVRGFLTYLTADGKFDASRLSSQARDGLEDWYGDLTQLTRSKVQAWAATRLLEYHQRRVRCCLAAVNAFPDVPVADYQHAVLQLPALWAGAARCEWELALEQGVSLVVATRAYVRTLHVGERLIACPNCPHNVVPLKRIRTSKGFQLRVHQVFRANLRNC